MKTSAPNLAISPPASRVPFVLSGWLLDALACGRAVRAYPAHDVDLRISR
jgi:hypothetical protein